MADRSISIALEARVAGFVAGIKTARQSVDDFGNRVDKFAKDNADSMDKVGKASALAGLGILAGIGVAVKSFAEFDKQMSEVQASTHETAGNMDLMRQAAIDAGADTAFSATDAAKAIDEMAKAGVSVKDILGGGLKGALALAAAGSLDVGEAAELAATAMTQFKLSGEDLPHIADLLAAGAGKAQGSVSDMGMALKQAGLVANQTGLSIEETTGGLAAFASAGLIGSDAGTAFKSMLQRLTPQSNEAKEKMRELGISAYDAQGNFIGLSKFSENLKTSMEKLTPEARNAAMGVIFGSDAVRAANVLYENGAKGIDEWTKKVNDAGFAAETAALKQNNLAGDFEKLTGSIDSVFLKSASGANEALRGLVQGAEDFVDGIGKIPGPVLQAGFNLTAVAGITLAVGGAFLTTLPKIQEGIEAFRKLETSSGKTAATLKGAGVVGALLAVGAALAAISTAIDDSKIERSVGKTTTALIELAKQNKNIQQCSILLDDLFQKKDGTDLIAGVHDLDSALTRTFKKDWSQEFNDWGEGLIHSVAPGIKGTSQQLQDSFKTIDDQLAAFVSSGNAELAGEAFKKIEDKARAQGIGIEELKTAFPGYFESLKQADADARVAAEGMERMTTAGGGTIVVTEDMQKALDDLGLSAQGAVTDLDKYAAALVRAGLSNLSLSDANRNYLAAIDAVDESIKQNGLTLDEHTAKGRANKATLEGIASAGLSEVQVMAKATDAYGNHVVTSDQLHAKMKTTYEDLKANAEKFYGVGAEAEAMTRKALGIPDNVDIDAYLHDFASQQLDNVGAKSDKLNGKVVNLSVNVGVLGLEQALEAERLLNRNSQAVANQYASGNAYRANGGIINYLASGGFPRFIPKGTDTVPAMLTPGEFVVNREGTAENRPILEAMNAGYKYAPAAAPQLTWRPQAEAAQVPMQMTGTLTMDSGEVLGVFRGVATQVMSDGLNQVASTVGGRSR